MSSTRAGSGRWRSYAASTRFSRQSGYKWYKRSHGEGQEGLQDRNRTAYHHPLQVAEAIEKRIVDCRFRHPTWGARKLRKVSFGQGWAYGEILKRAGLTRAQRKRRRPAPYTQPFQETTEANQVWCADFKGWFRTADQQRVDVLTISDAASRYLLRCQVVEKTDKAHVLAVFEAAFREYGLPVAIRTDNGPPFATRAIAGLSPLAVYWMKLGIIPERIAAGHPEQNGRHERMHRTLKAETAKPPSANPRAQQQAFDRFRTIYNQQRPHEALRMNTPAASYEPSARIYPARTRPLPKENKPTGPQQATEMP